jgi:dTDP-4-dehydrorhamnose reductase
VALRTVVVTGAAGQLGGDLVEAFAGERVHGLGHADLDIGDPAAVQRAFEALAPDVVVNAAAFTNVPRCEDEPGAAYALNAIAPRTLARVCRELGARLVHVSTDYVFDGAKRAPYVETDRPRPLNAYGITKLAGEYEVLAAGGRHQVVRTSGLYGGRPCRGKGGNFADAMLRAAAERPEVRVVADEVLTPTFTADLAVQLRVLALDGPPGLFHATNAGSCSWFEFAQAIFAAAGVATPLRPIGASEYGSPVARPAYSVLANAALGALGLDRMRPWRDALADCLRRRAAGQ